MEEAENETQMFQLCTGLYYMMWNSIAEPYPFRNSRFKAATTWNLNAQNYLPHLLI